MERKILFSQPDMTEKEIEEVCSAMNSGWITTGPRTKKLEKDIAAYCNAPNVACLNSATACLELSLRLLGIGEGDEVITTAYTYTASASSIYHTGAKIVLADTKSGSFFMDYDNLDDLITEKTKAIIPVDLGGVPCDYDKIFALAERNKHKFKPSNKLQESIGRIAIVADSAHSLGAEYKGRKTGSIADFTCFSFHAVKNLTTAEGGALCFRDFDGIDSSELYRYLMLFSLHGQSKDALAKTKIGAWEYDILFPAYKCNMTDIAAAMGLAQLERYDGLLEKRKRFIEIYNEELKSLNVTPLTHYTSDFKSSGHLYILSLNGKDRKFRDALIEEIAKMGVATNVHYKPLPLLTAYKNLGFDIKDYQNANAMFENEITLPLHTKLTESDIYYVSDCLKKALNNLGE